MIRFGSQQCRICTGHFHNKVILAQENRENNKRRGKNSTKILRASAGGTVKNDHAADNADESLNKHKIF